MWTNDQPDRWGHIPAQPFAPYWEPTVFRGDDAILRDHPEWLLRNTSGGYVWDNYQNNHIYNHAMPGAQKAWAEICLGAVATGVVDGCFADYAAMGGDDPAAPGQRPSKGVIGVMATWNVSEDVARAWVNGKNEALANLTAQLGGGVLIANGGPNQFTNAYNLEVWMPHDIASIQRAAASGKVVRVKTDAYAHPKPDVADAMAAFLIGTGPNVFFSGPYSCSIAPSPAYPPHSAGLADVQQRWRPEYDFPLGEPKGPGALGGGVWRRSFPGAEVQFNLTCAQGTIRWAGGRVTRGPGSCGSAGSSDSTTTVLV